MLRVLLLATMVSATALLGIASADRIADPDPPDSGEPAPPPDDSTGAEPKLITPTKEPAKESASVRLSHYHQVEASIRLSTGLRAIAPYNDEYCGSTDASRPNGFAAVCTGRSPFALDFELGFGVAHKIDAFIELRLGLESDFGMSQTDTNGTHEIHFSPGARFFFGDVGSSKLFTTAQVILDTSSYHNLAGGTLSADFGLRNLNGLWFDLDPAYGFYVFVGETASFARWLRFELEGGIGVQGRYGK